MQSLTWVVYTVSDKTPKLKPVNVRSVHPNEAGSTIRIIQFMYFGCTLLNVYSIDQNIKERYLL